MELSYLQKKAAREIIATVLHKIKTEETAAAASWKQTMQAVSKPAESLAKQVRNLNPKEYEVTRKPVKPRQPHDLVVIADQNYHTRDGTHPIPNRLAPRVTHHAFQHMNREMKADIGKSVVIQSGYRSPAYQLFVFLFQLQENNWDVSETLQTVALPGNSEHAAHPPALDLRAKEFIGHHENYDFSRTAQFRWLQENASDFGFSMTYPKNNGTGTGFEPWHWKHTNR